MVTTYYIVPAMTDIAGQCRIVACNASLKELAAEARSVRDHYRKFPEQWKEAGLMNSRGQVVALDAPPHVWLEFQNCEPLMAGLTLDISTEAPVPA